MAVIIAVAAAVWGAVAAAAAAVAGAITSVVTFLAAVVCEIGFALEVALAAIVGVELAGTLIAIGTVVYQIASVAYSIYSVVAAFSRGDTQAGIAGIVGAVGMVYSIAAGTLGGFIDTVVEGFRSFTEAINLELALKINNIVYLVSDDYRKTMNNVYVQVGKVSAALGNSGEFMQLLLRDAKALIQDTGAIMGRSYDLGELAWVNTLNDYFKVVQSRATAYQNNPGELIWDIDKYFFKPAVDTKAAVFQNLYGIVETVLTTADQTVDEITDVREKVGEVIEGLPEEMTKQITPYVKDVFSRYDGWIESVYTPAAATIEITLSRYSGDILRLGYEVYQLAQYIKNPAEYLERINALSDADKDRLGSIIEQILTGRISSTLEEWTKTYTPSEERLRGIMDLLSRKIKAPSWDVGELEAPSRPAGTEAKPRTSWDVGDY